MNPTVSIKLRQGLKNPFVGLRPFDTNESLLFFGRDQQVSELLERLKYSRFLSVIGNSGCGKSSLIRAGLIPKLKGGFLTQQLDRWQTAVMRPSNDPLYFLAEAIIKSEPQVKQYQQDEMKEKVAKLKTDIIQKGAAAICTMIEQINNDIGEPGNFLLLVDQFEELFNEEIKYKTADNIQTDAEGIEDNQIRFVNTILDLTRQIKFPVFVIITMRSDFLGNCNQFFGLPEAMNQGQYLVPRLDREQRRAAIEGPIKLFDAKINTILLNRLLIESDSSQDELPILQHAMMRTWEQWEKDGNRLEEIGLKNYKDAGGMEHALSDHANQVYDHLLKPGTDKPTQLTKNQKIAEIIFKSLTKIDDRGRRVRRPQELWELVTLCQTLIPGANAADVEFVLNQFREQGNVFLSPYKGTINQNTEIDISHESLIRKWDKLKDDGKAEGWITKEYNACRTLKWLSESVTEKRGLLQSLDIQRVDKWKKTQNPNSTWAQRYSVDYLEVINYINNSKANVIKKKITNYSFLVFIFILFFAGVSYVSKLNAKAETALAERKNSELEKQKAIDSTKALRLMSEKTLADARVLELKRDSAIAFEKAKTNVALKETEIANQKAIILGLQNSKVQEESYYYQIQLEPLFASEIFRDTTLKRLAINELLQIKKKGDSSRFNRAIGSMRKAINAKLIALSDPNLGYARIFEAIHLDKNIVTEAIGDSIFNKHIFYSQKLRLRNNNSPSYTPVNMQLLAYSPANKIYINNGTKFFRINYTRGKLSIENDKNTEERFNYSYEDSSIINSFSSYGRDSIIYLKNRGIYKLNELSAIGNGYLTGYLSKTYSNGAFSTDGKLLLTIKSRDSAYLWSIDNLKFPLYSTSLSNPKRNSQDPKVTSIKFLNNNEGCLIGYSDGDIKLWEFGKEPSDVEYEKTGSKNDFKNDILRKTEVSSIDISPKGNFVVCFESGALGLFNQQGKRKDIPSNINKSNILYSYNSKPKVSISPDERFVVLFNDLGAKLIELNTGISKILSVYESKSIGVYESKSGGFSDEPYFTGNININEALFLDNKTLFTYGKNNASFFDRFAVYLWMIDPDFTSLDEAVKSKSGPYLDFETKTKYGLMDFQNVLASENVDLLNEAIVYYANEISDSDSTNVSRRNNLEKLKLIHSKLGLLTGNKADYYAIGKLSIAVFENLFDKLNGRPDYNIAVKRMKEALSSLSYGVEFNNKSIDSITFGIFYNDLAWNQIMNRDSIDALKSSIKAFNYDTAAQSIIKNLALSYLVNHNYIEAVKIFAEYAEEEFEDLDFYDNSMFFNYYGDLEEEDDLKYKQVWLKDLGILERRGIISFKKPDIIEILRILMK